MREQPFHQYSTENYFIWGCVLESTSGLTHERIIPPGNSLHSEERALLAEFKSMSYVCACVCVCVCGGGRGEGGGWIPSEG